jgi:hypothetical protein
MTHPRLELRRSGPNAWALFDAPTGRDAGGITYVHAADGNHYRMWMHRDGVRLDLDPPLAQLAMAARALEDAIASENANRRSQQTPH